MPENKPIIQDYEYFDGNLHYRQLVQLQKPGLQKKTGKKTTKISSNQHYKNRLKTL